VQARVHAGESPHRGKKPPRQTTCGRPASPAAHAWPTSSSGPAGDRAVPA